MDLKEPLILVYFESCPNFVRALDLLNEAGLEFKKVCQDELAIDDPMKFYSSPSLLYKNEIIFGAKVKGGGCTVCLPSKKELLELLNT